MVRAVIGGPPESVRQSARHVLFVEGRDPSALDPQVLGVLLRDTPVVVDRLGPSSWVRSVSEALGTTHPTYYFLVDRDHHGHEQVESTWRNFPDPDTHNLLIWRRREMENYFLIPSYVMRSQYCHCDEKTLRATLELLALKRVFLEAANAVITRIREETKQNWIECFPGVSGFNSRASALQRLTGRREFGVWQARNAERMSADRISADYDEVLDGFLGGHPTPTLGHGNWLELMPGKKLFSQLVNQCFRVFDAEKRRLTGRDAEREVAKDLLRKPLAEQPQDFQDLHRLITGRLL